MAPRPRTSRRSSKSVGAPMHAQPSSYPSQLTGIVVFFMRLASKSNVRDAPHIRIPYFTHYHYHGIVALSMSLVTRAHPLYIISRNSHHGTHWTTHVTCIMYVTCHHNCIIQKLNNLCVYSCMNHEDH